MGPAGAGARASVPSDHPDLRGFGETPLPPESYADADDIAELLDHLGVADAAVVGSSLGGRVALELATRHPDRVNSMVLLCPAYRGVAPSAAAEAFDAAEDRLLEAGDVAGAVELNVDTWLGPEATAEVRDQLAAMQRQAFEVQLAAERQDPAPERLEVAVDPAKVAVPTVIVTGGSTLIISRRWPRCSPSRSTAPSWSGYPGPPTCRPWSGRMP